MKILCHPTTARISLLGVALLCIGSSSQALTRTVPIQYPTIQAAITASISGDTIVVSNGVYSQFGDVNIDTLGKAITIKSTGGAGSCILDGGNASQIFNIHSGETTLTVINGFTIQNGSNNQGGGIHITNSSPTITNCLIQYNNAGINGGGCKVDEGSAAFTPVFSNCTFFQNNAQVGGGLYITAGTAKVTNCTFINNNASAEGGGLLLQSDKTKLTSCSINSNTAGIQGGGIWIFSFSSPTLTNCTLHGNSSGNGGGIYVNLGSNPTLAGCTFSSNFANEAGALGFNDCPGKLTNCNFQNNSASTVAGAVESLRNKQTYSGCTFSNNFAQEAGALRLDNSTSTVTNCDFVSNFATTHIAANGGGALKITTDAGASTPVITGCIFYLNSSDQDGGAVLNVGSPSFKSCIFDRNITLHNGAGLESLNGTTLLLNCIFEFNHNLLGVGFGGALRLSGSTTLTHVTNCTFTKNSGGSAGHGFYNDGSCTVTINNTIVYEFAPGFNINGDGSASVTVNYSDIQDAWGGPGAHNISADPLFNNVSGGDLTLMLTSSCLNAANTVAPGYINKDINGKTRDSTPDMGAFEH